MTFAPLNRLFEPDTIALIGASNDLTKIGGRPLRFLRDAGFSGRVYGVNPKYKEVGGYPCVTDLADVPEPVDVALVAVPAAAVGSAIEACAAAHVPFAVVFSSGFAETGADGHREQDELVTLARHGGVRLLGPNALGVVSPGNRFVGSFATAFDRPNALLPGDVGFVSQSGALGFFIYALAQDERLGFSRFVSIGNESDIDVPDVIAYLAQDERTRVIGGYLETVRDGRRFLEAAQLAAEAGKPVAMLKVGRTEVGRRAAASHTGALAGTDAVYDAAFRQAGITRVGDVQQLLDLVRFHTHQRSPRRRGGIGILTISGGAGVWAADRFGDHGLDLVELAPPTRTALSEILPAFGSSANPVDMTGQILNRPELFATCLEILLADESVSTLVLLLGLQEANGAILAQQVVDASRRATDQLVAVSWLAGPGAAYRTLEDAGIAVFDDMSRCVDTVAYVLKQPRHSAGILARSSGEIPSVPGAALGEHDAKQLLAAMGIPVPAGRLCGSSSEARAAAAELGWPVVLKGQVPGIVHKTEHGLVRLDVGPEALDEAFTTVLAAAEACTSDGARPEGVLVEASALPGLELIVGVISDPSFGPTVMAGVGGVLVEVLEDVVFRVAPVCEDEALEMLQELRGAPLLRGVRGSAPLDVAAVARAISALSRFAAANAETVGEIEINPLRVYPAGGGVLALDVLVLPPHDGAATTAPARKERAPA